MGQPNWTWPELRSRNTVYEDDDVIVLDKPAGLSVHPERDRSSGQDLSTLTRGVEYIQAVHRLDKAASGALLMGKSKASTARSQTLFRNGDVHKIYLAIVGRENALGPDFDELPEHAVIELPIIDRGKGNMRGVPNWQQTSMNVARSSYSLPRSAFPSSKAYETALTTLRVVATQDDVSVVVLIPVTGRTHQLRVHLQAVQHPIFGDQKYSREISCFPRLSLHAWQLSFMRLSDNRRHHVRADPDDDFWLPSRTRSLVTEDVLREATDAADELTCFTQSLRPLPSTTWT